MGALKGGGMWIWKGRERVCTQGQEREEGGSPQPIFRVVTEVPKLAIQ